MARIATMVTTSVVFLLGALGCTGEPASRPCASSDECGAGWLCLDNVCQRSGEVPSDDDGPVEDDEPSDDPLPPPPPPPPVEPECYDATDCGDGYCLEGFCCPSVEQVCGSSCCAEEETCFAGACVVPGRVCHAEADCEEGQYCELSLDAEDETEDDPIEPPEGALCLMPTPSAGRCVDLPPECPGGVLPDDGTVCLPECEYHPDAGPLDARVRWRWGPDAVEYPNFVDVWATPAVARLYDTNCDGRIDEMDPPNVVFVSGNARGTCCSCSGAATSTCHTGVLRVLDGLTGQELWSLRRAEAGSVGFMGLSVALGDVDGDHRIDIVTVTGEGHVVVVDATGTVTRISDQPIPHSDGRTFGWGGGLAIADMDGDGAPEIAYNQTVFTTAFGGLTLLFTGSGAGTSLSTFADLDQAPDGHQELLAGRGAWKSDGSELWLRSDLPNGWPGLGDFDGDGRPETVLVGDGQAWILDAATGETLLGPAALGPDGKGGPPTVADFDGDGLAEIGIAQKDFYYMLKPHFVRSELTTTWESLEVTWTAPNHDFSSSVTGSTVFDFEGDGAAEVVYNDECFLWVYDGTTGEVRFAAPTTSFTATEASLVADVDGDGHAEILMGSNGADPSSSGWRCDVSPWNEPDPHTVRPAWEPPEGATAYRGVTLFADAASSWVGTRTLWNQHTYHVSNICDHRDDACSAPNTYGAIPRRERPAWTVGWLNNFRQNVQDEGLWNAPDATVSLEADCAEPVELRASLRNLGAALLPAGAEVGFYVNRADGPELLGTMTSTSRLLPGQVERLSFVADGSAAVRPEEEFLAVVHVDPFAPLFHECNEDNNESDPIRPLCIR